MGCFLVSSAGASNEAGMSMKVEGLVLHGDALHGEKEFRRALIIPPGVEFGHIIHDFDMDGEEENPSPASEDPPYSL